MDLLDHLASGDFVMHRDDVPECNLIFEKLFRKDLKIDWKSASEYLDTPEKTIRGWHSRQKFPPMAHKLLMLKWRGFLPSHGAWKDCYFNERYEIVTPWGVCKASDLAFVHRYKHTARLTSDQLKLLKNKSSVETQRKISQEAVTKMRELEELLKQLNPDKLHPLDNKKLLG